MERKKNGNQASKDFSEGELRHLSALTFYNTAIGLGLYLSITLFMVDTPLATTRSFSTIDPFNNIGW